MIQDRQFDTNGQLSVPGQQQQPVAGGRAAEQPGHPPVLDPGVLRRRERASTAGPGRSCRWNRAATASASSTPPTRGSTAWAWSDAATGATGPADLHHRHRTAACWTPRSSWPAAGGDNPGVRPDDAGCSSRPPSALDVIIDFAGLAGQTFTLTNDAQVPFPSGDPLDPADPTREVMQFHVNLPLRAAGHQLQPGHRGRAARRRNQEPNDRRLTNAARWRGRAGGTPRGSWCWSSSRARTAGRIEGHACQQHASGTATATVAASRRSPDPGPVIGQGLSSPSYPRSAPPRSGSSST